MSKPVFEASLKFILSWEGGYVNNPSDLGGPTNQGITQTTYDQYRRSIKQPLQTVARISSGEVVSIYRIQFWQPSYAYLFGYPLAVVLFDTQVQFALQTIAQFKAQALGLSVDTSTSKVIQKLKTCDQSKVAVSICQQRIDFRYLRVKQNPSQSEFLEGWLRRDNALLAEVQKTIGAKNNG